MSKLQTSELPPAAPRHSSRAAAFEAFWAIAAPALYELDAATPEDRSEDQQEAA